MSVWELWCPGCEVAWAKKDGEKCWCCGRPGAESSFYSLRRLVAPAEERVVS